METINDPYWKTNPDVVADESYEEIYAEEPEDEIFAVYDPE